MITILLHSSKTMKSAAQTGHGMQTPVLLDQASRLAAYMQSLSPTTLAQVMKITPALAQKTAETFAAWSSDAALQTTAIDCFKGDIYSGLQAAQLNSTDRAYAQKTLVILSGLYGMIRPLDSIMPYRLEMMYKFADPPYNNLYTFWGSRIADHLPTKGIIVNTSSVEYSKMVLPYVDATRVITPQFFTRNPKTGKPTFVTVHSKIARGAFARWLITTRTDSAKDMEHFNLLGYRHDPTLSQPQQPAFVANEFGGIGLSVRLQD